MPGVIKKLFSLIEARITDANLKVLLKGSSTALILRVAAIAVAYLFVVLITRGFGAEAMGIFALCLTLLQIAAVLGRLGLDTALLRFVAEYSSQGRKGLIKDTYLKAISLAVPAGILISALLFFLSPFIAKHVFHKELVSPYFRLSSLGIVPMILVYLHSEGLRGLHQIKDYVFFQFMGIFFFAACILAPSIYYFKGPQVPIIAFLVGLTITAVLGLIRWLKKATIGGVERADGMSFNELLSISLPMLLANSLILVMQWTDNIMIGIFRTTQEVGIYSTAVRVASLTSIMLFAISSIAAPKFAEFYGNKDLEGLGRLAQQTTKLIFWSSAPIFLIILIFPSQILNIFGPAFIAGATALLFLITGQFINAISGSVGYILQMTGKQNVFRNIILIAVILNLVLNLILIPRYGINGAAIASMTAMIFSNLASVGFVRIFYGFYIIYIPKILRGNQ